MRHLELGGVEEHARQSPALAKAPVDLLAAVVAIADQRVAEAS